jgi:NAD(P)-dependent dehydrogenase (short-subunit alcohol dehydrogenase family)
MAASATRKGNNAMSTILLIGASRGLGHAMAAEFIRKGWHVVGTVRAGARTRLHDLAHAHPGQLEIETLDITETDQIHALRRRLAGRVFDALFVNAGTTNPDPMQTIGEVSTEDFVNLMITNALSPMRVLETLAACVRADGLIGVMSSGQGSIANNHAGQRELYRGTKAALNQFMRSFAARQDATRRPMLTHEGGTVLW